MDEKETYVLEVVYEDHSSYFEVTEDDLKKLKTLEKGLPRANWVLENCKRAKIGSDAEINFNLYRDGSDGEEVTEWDLYFEW